MFYDFNNPRHNGNISKNLTVKGILGYNFYNIFFVIFPRFFISVLFFANCCDVYTTEINIHKIITVLKKCWKEYIKVKFSKTFFSSCPWSNVTLHVHRIWLVLTCFCIYVILLVSSKSYGKVSYVQYIQSSLSFTR